MLKYSASSSINSENHELQLLDDQQLDPGETLIQFITKLEEQIEALNELEIEIQKARKFKQLFLEYENSVEKILELYFIDYEFFSSKIINRTTVENIDKSVGENKASEFLESAEERRTILDDEIALNIEKIMHLLSNLSPSKEITDLEWLK